ncbi:MAG: 16S rRNA (cytosine(1402)-N(4))-methyltransferase RsmH [Oscillospiraceae bacterium]|nr:16S rRNA (cytosine(1402)-N(4))-methyltransferase RsmH [Oscillospiraceae bacterium]
MTDFNHKSVLLFESVDLLNVFSSGVYVDGTAGGGGHSREILKRLDKNGKLVCFDKDPDAIDHINNLFKNIDNINIIKSDFRYISSELDNININKIDGVLLDLGVSSYQIDKPERGFCYNQDAVLDMRMSKTGLSAYDIINSYDIKDLSKIFFEYGEEKFSWQIAKNIEIARNKKIIKTTGELCDIIKSSIPASVRRKGGNPCKRTFQAIRIAVNDELGSLSECIDSTFKKLRIGGRFCIITFHSLEDRVVKQKFTSLSQGCICPPDFPICVCNNKPKARLVNKKPILPSEYEINSNSRSKSAKLRVIEKILE